MMNRIGTAIGILFFAGATGLFMVNSVFDELIVGTSVEENIFTYIVPVSIFVVLIIVAFFAIFRKRNKDVQ